MPDITEERASSETGVLPALLEALKENRQASTEASRVMAASIDKLAHAHDLSTREIRDELRALGRLNTGIVVVAMLGLFGLLGVQFSIKKDGVSTSPMGAHVPGDIEPELKHDPDEKPGTKPTSPLMSTTGR